MSSTTAAPEICVRVRPESASRSEHKFTCNDWPENRMAFPAAQLCESSPDSRTEPGCSSGSSWALQLAAARSLPDHRPFSDRDPQWRISQPHPSRQLQLVSVSFQFFPLQAGLLQGAPLLSPPGCFLSPGRLVPFQSSSARPAVPSDSLPGRAAFLSATWELPFLSVDRLLIYK